MVTAGMACWAADVITSSDGLTWTPQILSLGEFTGLSRQGGLPSGERKPGDGQTGTTNGYSPFCSPLRMAKTGL